MRSTILMIGTALLLGAASPSFAVVNCKQVNKYLQTGRSVKDVAETMVIDEAEVRKCQEQAGDTKAGEAKPADEKAKEGAEKK